MLQIHTMTLFAIDVLSFWVPSARNPALSWRVRIWPMGVRLNWRPAGLDGVSRTFRRERLGGCPIFNAYPTCNVLRGPAP